jgi:hypothetical protein
MQFPSIFRRSKARHRVEPSNPSTCSPLKSDTRIFDDGDGLHHTHTNLFELSAARSGVSRAFSADVEAGDVIATLHERYCAALDSSCALGNTEWGSPLVSDASTSLSDSLGNEATQGDAQPISRFSSEPRRLEDVIGPLVPDLRSDLADLSVKRVPEILQLFAPSEYHANAAVRAHAVPPALARREHHTLAIDSALPVIGNAVTHPDNGVSTR